MELNPKFDNLKNPKVLLNHVEELTKKENYLDHSEILNRLITQFEPLDFEELAFPHSIELRKKLKKLDSESEEAKHINDLLSKLNLKIKHLLILSVENLQKVATDNNWGLCKNQEFIYLYNSAFWTYLEKEAFQKFLGESSEQMGIAKFTARYYQFREQLLKQFIATEYLPTPEPLKNSVLINLQNGTFEVTAEKSVIRQFNRNDFLTYQLPFEFNPDAQIPIFQAYLDKVLPDIERQKVLAEFLGYVFIKNGSKSLKEEKALILYGGGANGKSVFFEIVNALLGSVNISSHSLQNLTDENGYYRAMIANKLVNYASEISGKLETSIFKQMVSGEPISARLPHGKPMIIKQYAKMIFNCNELPKDVEHTNAYFRRFLIIPFDVTIPESEQDKELHTKIIENELSGVFNWVLEGLNRLLTQKQFTSCDAAKQAVEQYKLESDSVGLFLEEYGYKAHPEDFKTIKDLYILYRSFCFEDGTPPLKKQNFIKRLKSIGILIEKKNVGNVAFISVDSLPF